MMETSNAEILIIDDNPNNLRILTSMLEDMHYVVRPALNGKSALLSASTAQPDLILLDIMMPEMDGYEVCQRLKADPNTAEIPVIFLSAIDNTSDKIKALKLGGVDFITKPFQVDEVLMRVEIHLNLYFQKREIEYLHQQSLIQKQKIEKSEQRYRDLFENAHDLIQSVDHNGKFIYVNRHWYETLGYTPDELQDLNIFDIIHPDLRSECTDLLRNLQKTPDSVNAYETVFISKTHKEIIVDGNISAQIDEEGHFHTRGIFRDITRRKELEANALKTALARKRRDLLSEFVNNLSHEIRTPLAVILSQTEAIHRRHADPHNTERLDRIANQIAYLNKVLDQFQYYITITNQHDVYALKWFDISSVLKHLPKNLEHVSAQKNITISVNLLDGDFQIKADFLLLQTVFYHLLQNSLNFTQENGAIEVNCGRTDDAHYFIEVIDNGIGIPEKHIPHVFDLFYKADQARSQQADRSGSGIGLSLVKRIIEMHGGEVSLSTRPEHGTRVRIDLNTNVNELII